MHMWATLKVSSNTTSSNFRTLGCDPAARIMWDSLGPVPSLGTDFTMRSSLVGVELLLDIEFVRVTVPSEEIATRLMKK